MTLQEICHTAYRLRLRGSAVIDYTEKTTIPAIYYGLKASGVQQLTLQQILDLFAPLFPNTTDLTELAYRCRMSAKDTHTLVSDQSYQRLAERFRSYRVLDYKQLTVGEMVNYAASRI